MEHSESKEHILSKERIVSMRESSTALSKSGSTKFGGKRLGMGLSMGLALALSVGCQSSPDINDHWNASSTVPRVARAFLGYDSSRDGSYRDFAWERKASINLTLRRHLFNHNPENPNHAEATGIYEERPVNSLLPNPINFIHLEGLVLGLIPLAASGTYFPIPVDSIVGIFDMGTEGGEDGIDEFFRGVEETFSGTFGMISGSFVQNWISSDDEEEEMVVRAGRMGPGDA